MPQPRKLDDTTEAGIASAYAEGKSTSELATEFGVHSDTVRNAVKRRGVALRPRGGVPGKPRTR
jgi:transposase